MRFRSYENAYIWKRISVDRALKCLLNENYYGFIGKIFQDDHITSFTVLS